MQFPLSPAKLEEIHKHALAEYPRECCGIIIGKEGGDSEDILYLCTNIQDKLHAMDSQTYERDARTAYNIEPRELMKIFKEAEKKGMRIKFFYHSHPEHDAYFSEEDKRMALFDEDPVYPGAAYMVVSVYNKTIKRTALYSWNPDTKVFEEQF